MLATLTLFIEMIGWGGLFLWSLVLVFCCLYVVSGVLFCCELNVSALICTDSD